MADETSDSNNWRAWVLTPFPFMLVAVWGPIMTWYAVTAITPILGLAVLPFLGALAWWMLRAVRRPGYRLAVSAAGYLCGAALGMLWSWRIDDPPGGGDSRILFSVIGLPIVYAIGLPIYLGGFALGKWLGRWRIHYNPTGRLALRLEKAR